MDDEIVAEFLVESYENLERLGRELVALEADPTNAELLGSVFRCVHSIKGTSSFLGFRSLERLTHAGETVLARVRDGVRRFTPEIGDALLAMADSATARLNAIEQTGDEQNSDATGHDDDRLVTLLAELAAPPAPAPPAPAPAPARSRAARSRKRPAAATAGDATAEPSVGPAGRAERRSGGKGASMRKRPAPPPATPAPAGAGPAGAGPAGAGPAGAVVPEAVVPDGAPPRRKRLGEILVDAGVVTPGEISFAVHEQERGDPRMLGEILIEHGVTTEADIAAAVRAYAESTGDAPAGVPYGATGASRPASPPDAAAATGAGEAGDGDGGTGSSGAAASTIRVDIRLLDEMMRLVGELVLARNQILEQTSGRRGPMEGPVGRLDLITAELQAQVMATRMQPIGSAWRRFPRLLRDVAAACGKSVRLELDGADTELDRSLIEAVTDPLAHIVRNAVSHGIESPDERVAKGKPPEGVLSLRAFHEDGQVHIEVRDDGAGMSPLRIKAKAVENGIISFEQAMRMSDRDALDLIFVPGFSTATTVTSISGRGVGMDVVKTNVEKISGVLDIDSEVGVGTTITMKIPLTLAIVPALIVSCDDDRYAIPQNGVVELVHLRKEHARQSGRRDAGRAAIETVHGVPVFRLRGNLLPLVPLRDQLGLAPAEPEGGATIVVLAVRDRLFGLVVDAVHNTEEIVVKPLSRQLKPIPLYAGATIMGDGKVALILDVMGIARRSGVVGDVRAPDGSEYAGAGRRVVVEPTVPAVLVEGFGGQRQALTLQWVSRLEQLPRSALERAGGRTVVQYDGEILPLVALDELVGGPGDDGSADVLPTVICREDDRTFGLVVRRIVDVVELPERVVRDLGRPDGEPAPLVADGRVTELLAVGPAVRVARPDLFTPAGVAPAPAVDAAVEAAVEAVGGPTEASAA